MSIASRLEAIRSTLPEGVKLVAISKTKPVSDLQEAYDAGQRVFGENRVLEMVDKFEALPKDIEWHFVGHLQTNKVRLLAPFVSLIHAVDSERLLRQVQNEAERYERTIDVLLQMHIARESSKHGFTPFEMDHFVSAGIIEQLPNVRVRGLMGMATFTENTVQLRQEFGLLKSTFDKYAGTWFDGVPWFDTLSMGMSGDYQLAIEEGSTMVRVGSSIFGSRG